MGWALGRLRRLMLRVRRAAQFDRYARWRRGPIRAGTVLYEAFSGTGLLGNPEAIFRALRAAPDFAALEHIWVLSSRRAVRQARHGSRDDAAVSTRRASRVRYVRYRSAGYFKALATSQYLVNNAGFPPEFGKRPGQTYLNTWHGTPLKRMGYDVAGGAAASAHVLRNLACADFLLAQNRFMSTVLYEGAYRMRGAFTGLILEEGYPRVDRQMLTGKGFLDVRDRLERAGIALRGRNIILYAPTWKGPSAGQPRDETAALERVVTELQQRIGDDYVVLLKVHRFERGFAAGNRRLRGVLVPDEIPTNLVLGVASALVTDYSSVFFDFLPTGRPIAFHTPDMPDYSDARGFYLPPSTWPGPTCRTVAEVSDALHGMLAAGAAPHPGYARWQREFAPFDDGAAAQRVVDIVFRGNRAGYRLRRSGPDGRTRILVSLGAARDEGAVASAITLLNALDPARFDVSVTYAGGAAQRRGELGARLPRTARQFPRLGGMNGSKIAQLRRRLGVRRAARSTRGDARPNHRLWHDEAVRCFGATPFDAAIDAAGDDPFWSELMLHAGADRTVMWLHGDVAERMARAQGSLRRRLAAVAAQYARFDALVSATPALTELNRRGLASCTLPRQFQTVRTLPDARLVGAKAERAILNLAQHPRERETGIVLPPPWAWRLHRAHRTRWFAVDGTEDSGLLAAAVLPAFRRVHDRYPDTALAILGEQPAAARLGARIEELGLAGSAYLTGRYDNPYPILAAADAIVLPLGPEARPARLLEAALLGKQIVAIGPAWLDSVLPDGGPSLVHADVDALADAFDACLADGVTPSTLDLTAYRDRVRCQFDAAVGIRPEDDGTRRAPPSPHQESTA